VRWDTSGRESWGLELWYDYYQCYDLSTKVSGCYLSAGLQGSGTSPNVDLNLPVALTY
jgi:hypothetical protein